MINLNSANTEIVLRCDHPKHKGYWNYIAIAGSNVQKIRKVGLSEAWHLDVIDPATGKGYDYCAECVKAYGAEYRPKTKTCLACNAEFPEEQTHDCPAAYKPPTAPCSICGTTHLHGSPSGTGDHPYSPAGWPQPKPKTPVALLSCPACGAQFPAGQTHYCASQSSAPLVPNTEVDTPAKMPKCFVCGSMTHANYQHSTAPCAECGSSGHTAGQHSQMTWTKTPNSNFGQIYGAGAGLHTHSSAPSYAEAVDSSQVKCHHCGHLSAPGSWHWCSVVKNAVNTPPNPTPANPKTPVNCPHCGFITYVGAYHWCTASGGGKTVYTSADDVANKTKPSPFTSPNVGHLCWCGMTHQPTTEAIYSTAYGHLCAQCGETVNAANTPLGEDHRCCAECGSFEHHTVHHDPAKTICPDCGNTLPVDKMHWCAAIGKFVPTGGLSITLSTNPPVKSNPSTPPNPSNYHTKPTWTVSDNIPEGVAIVGSIWSQTHSTNPTNPDSVPVQTSPLKPTCPECDKIHADHAEHHCWCSLALHLGGAVGSHVCGYCGSTGGSHFQRQARTPHLSQVIPSHHLGRITAQPQHQVQAAPVLAHLRSRCPNPPCSSSALTALSARSQPTRVATPPGATVTLRTRAWILSISMRPTEHPSDPRSTFGTHSGS